MGFEKIYRYCIYAIAFLVPSGFFGLSLAIIAAAGVCWLAGKGIRTISFLKRPQVYLPILLYLYFVCSGFFMDNMEAPISGISVYFT
jgi:hypothetical protein